MEKVEYPKFLYHKELEEKLVHSKEQHDLLGSEWLEAPHSLDAKAPEEVKKPSKAKAKK